MEEFLKEYEALCKKYNMIVDACGCCNSPWVIKEKSNKDVEEHITYLQRNIDPVKEGDVE